MGLLKMLVSIIAFASFHWSCESVSHPPPKPIGPASCPLYTHKYDAMIGGPASLPDGFFVFDRDTIPGLYKSRVHNYQASLIPNTEHDYPRTISISNDGKWVLYLNGYSAIFYLIRANGCGKTIVPVTNAVQGSLTICGFYRNSPYVSEIFYLASMKQIHALGVDLSSDLPTFKSDRVLADVGDSLLFWADPALQLAVVKDQIFGEINPIVNGEMRTRTGYLTIPD